MNETSLDYLSNVYDEEHVRAILSLAFLEAIAFGKAIRSERPVLIEIECDEGKKKASQALEIKVSEPNHTPPDDDIPL